MGKLKNRAVHIFFSFFALFIVLLVFLIFDFEQPIKSGLYKLTFLNLLVYLFIFISSYKYQRKINVYTVLILLTIPFYLGDQLSIVLGYENKMLEEYRSILDGVISNRSIFMAMFLIMWSLLFLHVGYLLTYKPRSAVKTIEQNAFEGNRAGKIVGWLFLIVTLIPALITRIYDVYMTITLGHLAYRLEAPSTGFIYYMSYFADWFVPSSFILLIFSTNRIEKRIATGAILLYCLLYLLSGNRMDIFGYVVALVCVYIYRFRSKITKKKVFLATFFGLFTIFVFEIVGYSRNAAGGISMFSLDNILSVISEGLIYSVFRTTGNTFTSVSNTIQCVPALESFNYGKSILGSLVYVFPSVLRGNSLDNIVTHISALLSPYYYGWNVSGYGSSFITEAFFNYGYFSIFIVCIYGMIIGKIVSNIENGAGNRPFLFYFSIFMLIEITMGIRNDLYFIPRHIVLYVAVPYIFYSLLSIKSNFCSNRRLAN